MRNSYILAVSIVLSTVVASWLSASDPWKVSLDMGAAYTDNRDAVEVNEESTWDFSLSPKLAYHMDSEATKLNVYYQPTYRYRTEPSIVQNENEFQHALGIVLDHAITPRTRFYADERLAYTDDPKVDEHGAPVRANESYLHNRVSAGVLHEVTRNIGIRVSGRHLIKRYDDAEVAARADKSEAAGDLTGLLQVNRNTVLRAFGSYTAYDFDTVRNIERDLDALLAGLGVDRVFSAQLKGSVSVGYQVSDHKDPMIDNPTAVFGDASVRFNPSPLTGIVAGFGHGLRDADVFPFASQEFAEFKAEMFHDITPRVRLTLRGVYRDSTYDIDNRPSQAIPADFAKLAGDGETTSVAAAEIRYSIDERTSLRLEQKFEDVDSDVAVTYTRNTSMLVYHKSF